MSNQLKDVKALLFDVFGTVVDWRGTIIRELTRVGNRLGISRDWGDFADRWRDSYYRGAEDFRAGKREWVKADTMHWEQLQSMKVEYGLAGLSKDELSHLNKVWHRLSPWPDAIEGLNRLRHKFIIGTLSNGNNGLLLHMAKNAGLPWDMIMGAENFQSFKPEHDVYFGAVHSLGYQPHQVMMVAAHLHDLHAARDCGLQTAFVVRPYEFGNSSVQPDLIADEGIDLAASDFIDLAIQMHA